DVYNTCVRGPPCRMPRPPRMNWWDLPAPPSSRVQASPDLPKRNGDGLAVHRTRCFAAEKRDHRGNLLRLDHTAGTVALGPLSPNVILGHPALRRLTRCG